MQHRASRFASRSQASTAPGLNDAVASYIKGLKNSGLEEGLDSIRFIKVVGRTAEKLNIKKLTYLGLDWEKRDAFVRQAISNSLDRKIQLHGFTVGDSSELELNPGDNMLAVLKAYFLPFSFPQTMRNCSPCSPFCNDCGLFSALLAVLEKKKCSTAYKAGRIHEMDINKLQKQAFQKKEWLEQLKSARNNGIVIEGIIFVQL
ncbi:hypothetical protein SELMODRAFT_425699 [Selaginella moellendorffii]|uniref:Uncharacterized protein n=1 Tax=Selaginella moellendorffii TaxID=88036 RepID=D8STZ9_SELML|nr:hypothetical protein SELMODRAFT_425699 [Selaginella moellendorffii]